LANPCHLKKREIREVLNFTTGVENFLFQVIDDRDAWSIFTIQDNRGQFQHLAHVHWFLRYDLTFQWRANAIQLMGNLSRFRVEPAAKGAPPEPALQSLLSSISPTMSPLANDQTAQALRTVLIHPNPNRSDNANRFSNVPRDFFQ